MRLFDLAAMGFVETLFGHQDCIQDMDALRAETAVSVGGRDRTVRFWKVPEESQLVFRGGRSTAQELLEDGLDEDQDAASTSQTFVEGSLDCVAMIDETSFVSGGDSGCVIPAFTVPFALAQCFSQGRYVSGIRRRRNQSSRFRLRMVSTSTYPKPRVS